ncbi:flagellar biosynthesis protein FlhB [Pseudovibrio exalbescens]|uniref:Flagellar biosynthetic protein FlhB n=1 Tax=Pseudovibrio exalbescens TaxID=197461 RepID=A0A1U7JEM9_9HYPH|nr:flagellar biosynthesis protein FlhB [Pseudovibrio exalbescens]OKL43101.1 flagellar biosynthesis protein FlhB [Pseudovibrio exalbescens]
MSEDQDKESKTEEPTEKRIRDAIEKGNIPVSKEASVLASFVGMMFILTFMLNDAGAGFSGFLRWFLDNPGEIRMLSDEDAVELLYIVSLEFGRFFMPIAGLLIILGLAASFLQNAPRLVLDRIQPKLNRISPIKGFGRIYSMNGFMEFVKSLIKLSIVGAVALIVLRSQQAVALTAMYQDPSLLPQTILQIAIKLLSAICVATIALVGFDLVLARFQWRKNLRMTRQDIKDEYKQAEGDPILKARMRSLARDRARKRMMSSVAEATVVVANPTHFAVALHYDRGENSAPRVTAKGQDLVALKIKEIAYQNDVPVVENKELARGLHAAVAVDQYIPPEYYRAVAEIISYVYVSRR